VFVSRSTPRAAIPTSDSVSTNACHNLLRTCLSTPRLNLFHDLTRLPLHVLWHQPLEAFDSTQRLVLCPVARRKQRRRGVLPVACDVCLRQHWRGNSSATRKGSQFEGQCGATCFRASLFAGPARLLTLVLWTPGKAVVAFHRAVALVRQILDELEATFAANQACRELELARRRNQILETEAAHRRQDVKRRRRFIPPGPAPATARSGTHREQLMQTMLDYVHVHYCRAPQLRDVAAALRMNASYLSSLFTATVGVTFHQYRDELRLARAKTLLRDPANRVCEVACAVGYASAGQFWRAFKAHTGLAPGAWRESAA
jgi:AraC-like DNA-binding protein